MSIEKLEILMKVIGKRERTKGLIFKKSVYSIALQIIDETLEGNPTHEKKVPWNEYCSLNTGDLLLVTMYTSNGHSWFFSKKRAELYEKFLK